MTRDDSAVVLEKFSSSSYLLSFFSFFFVKKLLWQLGRPVHTVYITRRSERHNYRHGYVTGRSSNPSIIPHPRLEGALRLFRSRVSCGYCGIPSHTIKAAPSTHGTLKNFKGPNQASGRCHQNGSDKTFSDWLHLFLRSVKYTIALKSIKTHELFYLYIKCILFLQNYEFAKTLQVFFIYNIRSYSVLWMT